MRGMVLMLALIVMAAGMALTNSSAQTSAGAWRAQELLTAARTSLGGEAKLKALNSLSASGKFRRRISGGYLSGELTCDLLIPDKYLRNEIMIPVPGASITSIDIVNGEQVELDARTSGPGLMFNRPGSGNASAEAKTAAQRAVRAEYARLLIGWLLTASASFPIEFAYAGEADALGARADVIEAKGRDNFAARLFLDQKTHRPVMLTYRERVKPSAQYRAMSGESNAEIQQKIQELMAKGETEVEMQNRFSDYRAVDGVSFPHRMTKMMDGVVSEEWELSKFTLNPAIKLDKFGKKEEPKPSGGEARQLNNEPSKSAQVSAPDQSSAESADSLFKAGKFAEAEKLYAKAVAQDAKNYHATLRLGHLALLGNKLDDAQKWLTKAIELKPDEKSAKAMLGEAYYRRDDFQRAAPLFAAAGKEAKAKKLESFKDAAPYQIEGQTQIARLKLVHTDPLPLVQVKVNDSEAANFIIDTGGGEAILDTEFAKKIGAVQFGSELWTFGGDQRAEMGEGRVASLMLGDFVVKNVPVNILSTRRFAAAARGKQVDGIIGTVLLYHFISTLDYANGELVLRRRTAENLQQIEQQATAEKQISMPFWLVGDHLMVAWGTVNKSQPVLFYVDTGAAGVGFTCPQSMLDEAGIKLSSGQGSEGVGGGGTVKIVPFTVDELSLGAAKEQNITGIFGAFPASLEQRDGFRIAGLISHQFFRPYALTMDFSGMKFFLKKGN